MAHFEWENANGSPSTASSPLQESKQLKVNAIESASHGVVGELTAFEAALRSKELWENREKMMV